MTHDSVAIIGIYFGHDVMDFLWHVNISFSVLVVICCPLQSAPHFSVEFEYLLEFETRTYWTYHLSFVGSEFGIFGEFGWVHSMVDKPGGFRTQVQKGSKLRIWAWVRPVSS